MTVLLFFIFLAACLSAATTGAVFQPDEWYETLKKPSWTPPNWLFPLAWTILYIAIAIAGTRLALLPNAGLALALWALQIALNTLWTPIFFGVRDIWLGLIIIFALWLAVLICTIVFFSFEFVAGILFAPYAVWVSYAAALNLSIYLKNPQ
ncbi:MAG: TspO/MBR family protein [Pseudomonadota bacterium]